MERQQTLWFVAGSAITSVVIGLIVWLAASTVPKDKMPVDPALIAAAFVLIVFTVNMIEKSILYTVVQTIDKFLRRERK